MIQVDNRLFGTKEEGTSILRGTPLGSPFKIGDQHPIKLTLLGSKEDVQAAYESYLRWQIYLENPVVIDALLSLVQGGTLICTCNHHTCHGYVIRDILEEVLNADKVSNQLER